MVFHRAAFSSGWTVIRMVFHRAGVLFHQGNLSTGGFSSGWSFIRLGRAVLHQTGLFF